jgi:hypothetical protein
MIAVKPVNTRDILIHEPADMPETFPAAFGYQLI